MEILEVGRVFPDRRYYTTEGMMCEDEAEGETCALTRAGFEWAKENGLVQEVNV